MFSKSSSYNTESTVKVAGFCGITKTGKNENVKGFALYQTGKLNSIAIRLNFSLSWSTTVVVLIVCVVPPDP